MYTQKSPQNILNRIYSTTLNALGFSLSSKLSGEDQAADVQKVEHRYLWANITSATTTTPTSAVYLHTLTINKTDAGTIIIKDGSSVVGTIKASTAEQTFTYDISTPGGLSIVTAAASDITISYRTASSVA